MAFPPVARIGVVATLPTSRLIANDRVVPPSSIPAGLPPVLGFLLTLPKIDQRLRLQWRHFRMSLPLEFIFVHESLPRWHQQQRMLWSPPS